ncbi:lectin [Streptomyces sp. ZAF1911]|uniref:lectin n=1 Tax=Streptomyces sp. ZAF1911 TaxID=2944129 RepID=UPI00237B953C|nr:lectin [Streptomyces sp. ZAF1911]MDD9375924.1 lectin [Streptomyces sp. ZAF1911]
MIRKALLFLAAALLTTLALAPAAAASGAQADPSFKVLVFSKTDTFRHDSIPTAIQTIKDLGAANGFTVDVTEDDTVFTRAGLSAYKTVVFALTTGDVLNDAEQAAFEGYIRAGGGYAGIHAAADTEYAWPFYGELVGAYFKSHPAQQQATVKVEDLVNPSTAHLPASWSRFDEWYAYRSNPRTTAHVLASLDETSYSPGSGAMGDHPITWCKNHQGGRSWYTGMGHTKDSYADPAFRKMLLGGIRYTAGAVNADCTPSGGGTGTVQAESFQTTRGGLPVTKAGADNGQTLGYLDPGDWVSYASLPVGGSTTFKARVVSGGAGGTMQIRTGSPTGPVLGSVTVPNTGGWTTFKDVSTTLTGVPSGRADVYLTFTGTGSSLLNVDDFAFNTPAPGQVSGLAGKCLDVAGAATTNGTQVQLSTCNGGYAQQWTRTPAGELRALGKCLDVSGGATADGTKVDLWDCNASAAQQWTPTPAGELRNPQSGKCLDVSGAGTADGTKVLLWTCWGGANQRWSLPG